ncbi:MAG TPA: divalent metal cation transporter [Chloroflexota bacterium]|nr:divalent metal cation transporter [Chloroflexota bacterium]
MAETASHGRSVRDVLGALTSGLIAGGSDNDPTSVATLAVIGSTLVYDLNWLILLVLPMLLVIQIMSARVGVVTRKNLIEIVNERFGGRWTAVATFTLLVVNVFTLGADLEGGAAAAGLMFNLPWQWFVVPLAGAIGIVLVFGNYEQISRILRYFVLVFAAYILAAFLARPDWSSVLYHTFVPTIRTDRAFVAAVLALLGTTLTSYVYVWETIEEEEEHRPIGQLRLVELDAAVGIGIAVLLFWFITVATGATLGVHHQPVATAEDAARALEPIAGPFAGFLFALGLLASALLAVPILSATSAYVMAATFRWRGSLNEPVGRGSRAFYAVLVGSLVIGVGLTVLGVEPIQLLFFAGIVGGIGTPLLLVFLLLIAGSQTIMGRYRVSGFIQAIGWLSAIVIGLASIVYLFT